MGRGAEVVNQEFDLFVNTFGTYRSVSISPFTKQSVHEHHDFLHILSLLMV